MQDQEISYQDDSLTHTVRVFLLGMTVAFLISIGISYGNPLDDFADSSVIDCDDPVNLSAAQDQSRNGIANVCL